MQRKVHFPTTQSTKSLPSCINHDRGIQNAPPQGKSIVEGKSGNVQGAETLLQNVHRGMLQGMISTNRPVRENTKDPPGTRNKPEKGIRRKTEWQKKEKQEQEEKEKRKPHPRQKQQKQPEKQQHGMHGKESPFLSTSE
jgi:hypothetical protein